MAVSKQQVATNYSNVRIFFGRQIWLAAPAVGSVCYGNKLYLLSVNVCAVLLWTVFAPRSETVKRWPLVSSDRPTGRASRQNQVHHWERDTDTYSSRQQV